MIRKNLVWVQLAALAVTVGVGILAYCLAVPVYYNYRQDHLAWLAYEDLLAMDLTMLEYSDESVLWQYERQDLRFTIADEDLSLVYATRIGKSDRQVSFHILKYRDQFSKSPDILDLDTGHFAVIKLLALIEQDGKTYYASIRAKSVEQYLFYENIEFLLIVFLAVLCISAPVLHILYRRMARPLEEIIEAAEKIAGQETDVHIREDGPDGRLNSLARNINRMARQIQDGRRGQDREKGQSGQMEQSRELLENIRKDVVADISHELKTPLAIISSQVEMLQCMEDQIDRDYYYGSIVEEVSRMSDMVGELMELSLLEQKIQKMEQCKINLTDTMEYIRMKYQALFGQNHIRAEFSLEPKCYVRGNAHYLEQAIDNYIMNAFSHTAQGNVIRVRLYGKDGWVWVTVYNQGKKIAPSDMEKIWREYVLQRPQQTQDPDGRDLGQRHMGVGLYLVRRIIRLHQGECGAANLDDGVEFWFQIPAAEEGSGAGYPKK